MDTIIRAPRGTLRNTIKVDEIIVPDLWHAAEYHREQIKLTRGPHRVWHQRQNEMILEIWHLAHDLVTNIQADRDNIKL